jgi:HEAT repeat protein
MSTRERALDALLARPARVAPLLATRERAQLLTPERAPFDGKIPDPTLLVTPPPAEGGDAGPLDTADLDTLDVRPKKAPADGPFIVLAGSGAPLDEGPGRVELVAQCADTMGMLAEHRAARPMRELAENERQLFAQLDAFAASGGDCVRSMVLFWREHEDDAGKNLAAALALASLDGIDSLRAVLTEIERLPADAAALVAPLAEALVLAPHPHVGDLLRDLLASESPLARAAAIDALGRRSPLSLAELKPHLEDPEVMVVAAAVRSAGALTPPVGAPLLFPLMGHREPAIAWPAARQLLLWGRPEPYFEVRSGRAEGLGQHALEVLVYAGAAPDLELFERIASRAPASPEQLSAIARFGAPTAWALLSHHLGTEDLAEAAAAALVTLFGERVPTKELEKPAAWRSAIAGGRFDAMTRYRRGEPWRPRAVAAELRRADFPRAEMAVRLDELAIRTGARVDVDLARWAPDVRPALELAAIAFEKADGQYPPGTWTTRAR